VVGAADSTRLTPEEVRAAGGGGGFRLWSVDGAHTAAATAADCALGAAVLALGGVLIVDDVHNADWPGVGEGFHAFMAEQRTAAAPLVPFAVGLNKVRSRHRLDRRRSTGEREVESGVRGRRTSTHPLTLGGDVACASE